MLDEHVQRSMFSDDDKEYIDTDNEGYNKVYSGWWCLDWWCETILTLLDWIDLQEVSYSAKNTT